MLIMNTVEYTVQGIFGVYGDGIMLGVIIIIKLTLVTSTNMSYIFL